MDSDLYHYLFWTAEYCAIFTPIFGIVLGRVVFGTLAEGARIRSRETMPPVFSHLQDTVLLGLFCIPWYLLCLFTRELF